MREEAGQSQELFWTIRHAIFESALSSEVQKDDVSQAGEGASGTDCERSSDEIALRDHVIYSITSVRRKGELTSSMDKREGPRRERGFSDLGER